MKYQFEESMKEVLKIQKGESDALNRKIFHHASATETNRHGTYFYPGRFAICTLTAITVLLIGGIGISYAAGVKPVQVVLEHFSKRDESVINKNEHKGTTRQKNEHELTLNEYYLDALGNGYMAFSLTKKDGGKEKDLTFGRELKAYYTTDAEKNKTQEFYNYDIQPVYSKQQTSIDGIQLSFYGTRFLADGGEIVIEIGKEKFTFSDTRVTQSHYYEWESPEGSIFLSNVGMIVDVNTKLYDYFNGSLDTMDFQKVATVVYKDGHQDSLKLSHFLGTGDDYTRVSMQFSPYTDLENHIEGRTWEEVEDEWNYNLSTYIFNLEEISIIQIGDIVLDVTEASYH